MDTFLGNSCLHEGETYFTKPRSSDVVERK